MYELIQAGEKSWYIDCPARIGVYDAGAEGVYLIDSGGDRDAGRKARQILDGRGWKLAGILNTHSHADHIGGNRYLQSQTGCRVFSGGMEGAVTRFPLLEPTTLYGGAPMRELRHKFLMAQGSDPLPFSDASFPGEVEVIPLPGHSFDMAGFRTPDGTFFAGDCVSSPETLAKYAVPFIFDVGAFLDTLERVGQMQAPLFVPSHAQPCRDMRELCACNKARVLEIADKLLELCGAPVTFEAALRGVFKAFGMEMTVQQHALVGSTVRSFLSWMCDDGRVEMLIDDGLLLWQSI